MNRSILILPLLLASACGGGQPNQPMYDAAGTWSWAETITENPDCSAEMAGLLESDITVTGSFPDYEGANTELSFATYGGTFAMDVTAADASGAPSAFLVDSTQKESFINGDTWSFTLVDWDPAVAQMTVTFGNYSGDALLCSPTAVYTK